MAMIFPAYPIPFPYTTEGFYATNNPFQRGGPKGFTESKMIRLRELYVRTDLPGVGQDGYTVSIDESKKSVTIRTLPPPLGINIDFSPRLYETTTHLRCQCCEIQKVSHQISDGVLRLVIFMTPINEEIPSDQFEGIRHRFLHDPDPSYAAEFTGPTMRTHPGLTEGPSTAYEYKQLPDGSANVRLDMPGVPKVDFTIDDEHRRVIVSGLAPAVSHDSNFRFYYAVVAMVSNTGTNFSRDRAKLDVKNGVIRFNIPSA